MFDPTIFENLKVALENIVYDLDNLDQRVLVTGRTDIQDMAVMSRKFTLRFELVPATGVAAEICLEAYLKDLAAEILELPGENPGCSLSLRFYMNLHGGPSVCERIQKVMDIIWEPEVPPVQTLSYVHGESSNRLSNRIELKFPRKINEHNMTELPSLTLHIIRTLEELSALSEA